MSDKVKPRIKRRIPIRHDDIYGWLWQCTGLGYMGLGDEPMWAYWDWKGRCNEDRLGILLDTGKGNK